MNWDEFGSAQGWEGCGQGVTVNGRKTQHYANGTPAINDKFLDMGALVEGLQRYSKPLSPFFCAVCSPLAIAQPGGRGRLGRAALGTHACLAACGSPCSKARALQMLKGTLRGPLIFGAQGSEVSTARDLSPEARSSPFATPGQK